MNRIENKNKKKEREKRTANQNKKENEEDRSFRRGKEGREGAQKERAFTFGIHTREIDRKRENWKASHKLTMDAQSDPGKRGTRRNRQKNMRRKKKK